MPDVANTEQTRLPLLGAVPILRAAWLLGRVLVACALLLACAQPGHTAAATAKPSIVLILTDDQEVASVEHMPSVRSLIVRAGTTFERAYVNEPLCCPSRATILTGKYAQNTRVTENRHRQFYEAGNPASTFAVWLKAAGYRTGLVGKYLNHYPEPAPETYVPPGWDRWAARLGDRSEPYDYTLNEDGRLVRYGSAEGDYATDVYREKAVAFIEEAAADGVPFFLHFGVHAPHRPSTPAPRHAALFPDLAAPRPPSFDEADIDDKPAFVRALGRFSAETLVKLDEAYRQRVRSLQAVDEAVRAIVGALAAVGRLDETYVVFTSDNGWLHGQHRVLPRKRLAYEEVIRVPLHVRGPGVEPGLLLEHLVGNVDLAPTFAEWAGAEAPDEIDGRSLAPLLRAGAPAPEAWRRAYPLVQATAATAEFPAPDWRGVRTRDQTYVEYTTGERELYDNARDPHQLRNLVGSADPALLARLARLTADLGGCAAAGCRRLEDAPP